VEEGEIFSIIETPEKISFNVTDPKECFGLESRRLRAATYRGPEDGDALGVHVGGPLEERFHLSCIIEQILE
jgi:hypothetical protein